MKNILLMLSLAILLAGCEDLFDAAEDAGLTEGEIVEGLKDALSHGTDTAVANLNILDGYLKNEIIKILLPKEAAPIYDRINQVPLLDTLVAQTIITINRAAEDAASEAKPIFGDAVKALTIEDGLAILHGRDTAATHYLRLNTRDALFDAFKPKIQASLEKEIVLGISAEKSYQTLINTYNSGSLNGLLYDKIETNSLAEHTTNKGLRGLFIKVGDEERLIRENPLHRVTEILKKVFAELDE